MTDEQKGYFKSILSAAYYYSNTFHDSVKLKGLIF